MITETLAALLFIIIGAFAGAGTTCLILFNRVDALMGVDLSDPDKDKYSLVILCPMDDLRKKKHLIVEVKQTSQI